MVEVQQTFYEPPSIALATKWRGAAPAAFRFTMKAWQLITHTCGSPTYRRLKSNFSPQEMTEFGAFQPTDHVWMAWERTREVARALAAEVILFQCPASFQPTRGNVRNMEEFFGRVERDSATLLAWEPRGDWPEDLVQRLCSALDLVHCVDPFGCRTVHGDVLYYRLHGKGTYRYRYSDEELLELHRMVAESTAAPAYVLFNNIWMRQDALRFIEIGASGALK